MKTEKEILEAVRVLQEANPHDEGIQNWVRNYFPELKESDDERIRKALINGFNKLDKSAVWYNGITNGQMLTWLEKQGNPKEDELEALRMAAYEPTKNWSEKLQSLYEKLTHCEQKPVIKMKSAEENLGIDSDTYNKIVDECIYGEQKPANKVEPKFKVKKGEWYVCTNTFVSKGKIIAIKGQTYQSKQEDDTITCEDNCLFIDRHDGKVSDYLEKLKRE